MLFQITLGDVIGWIVTIVSVGVGVAVTVKVNISINRNGDKTKTNQSKSRVQGDQIGRDKISGDKNGK